MKGREFKQIRERLGLTQEELSQILCLSGKQAVSNIETEFRNPSKLVAVLLRCLDRLPTPRSTELRMKLKSLSEDYDLELHRRSK